MGRHTVGARASALGAACSAAVRTPCPSLAPCARRWSGTCRARRLRSRRRRWSRGAADRDAAPTEARPTGRGNSTVSHTEPTRSSRDRRRREHSMLLDGAPDRVGDRRPLPSSGRSRGNPPPSFILRHAIPDPGTEDPAASRQEDLPSRHAYLHALVPVACPGTLGAVRSRPRGGPGSSRWRSCGWTSQRGPVGTPRIQPKTAVVALVPFSMA